MGKGKTKASRQHVGKLTDAQRERVRLSNDRQQPLLSIFPVS